MYIEPPKLTVVLFASPPLEMFMRPLKLTVVLAYATQEAVDGKNWPGYKLVAGRTVRKYTSEAEVIKAATEAGYTDIYKTSLLGVGDLEKRLGRKKFNEVLGKFIVKPAGAPTLVPETDPRKPYSDAASDFNQ